MALYSWKHWQLSLVTCNVNNMNNMWYIPMKYDKSFKAIWKKVCLRSGVHIYTYSLGATVLSLIHTVFVASNSFLGTNGSRRRLILLTIASSYGIIFSGSLLATSSKSSKQWLGLLETDFSAKIKCKAKLIEAHFANRPISLCKAKWNSTNQPSSSNFGEHDKPCIDGSIVGACSDSTSSSIQSSAKHNCGYCVANNLQTKLLNVTTIYSFVGKLINHFKTVGIQGENGRTLCVP